MPKLIKTSFLLIILLDKRYDKAIAALIFKVPVIINVILLDLKT